MNYMVKIALRFRSDLAELIEANRRRSRATLRIWRLKFGQRWPEDEMQDDQVICLQFLRKRDDMFRYIIHLFITLGLALYVTGCAGSNAQITSEIPPMHTVSEFSDDENVSHTHDPWEGFNK